MNEELIGEQRRIWWICSSGPGHVWQADATSNLFEGSACPCCSGRQPCDTEQLPAASQPMTAKQSGSIPVFVRRGWWVCRQNDMHVWFVNPDVTEEVGRPECPYCPGD